MLTNGEEDEQSVPCHADKWRRGAEKIYVEVGGKWKCSMLSNGDEEELHFNDLIKTYYLLFHWKTIQTPFLFCPDI